MMQRTCPAGPRRLSSHKFIASDRPGIRRVRDRRPVVPGGHLRRPSRTPTESERHGHGEPGQVFNAAVQLGSDRCRCGPWSRPSPRPCCRGGAGPRSRSQAGRGGRAGGRADGHAALGKRAVASGRASEQAPAASSDSDMVTRGQSRSRLPGPAILKRRGF